MKDIIYPTIKKQFDKLTPEWDSYYYNFIDDEGESHLHYYGNEPAIYASIEFFYLNYFGVEEEVFNKPVANIFIDLVKQSLGSEFEPFRKMGYKDVFFMYDNNF
jgi:hypothetical protein